MSQFRPIRLGEEIYQRKKIRFGVKREQRRKHGLAAAPGVEPVVDEGDAHWVEFMAEAIDDPLS